MLDQSDHSSVVIKRFLSYRTTNYHNTEGVLSMKEFYFKRMGIYVIEIKTFSFIDLKKSHLYLEGEISEEKVNNI